MIDPPDAYESPAKGMAVMVRAVGDKPLAFVAVAAGEVVVEVVDDDREKHASIGVPRRRVFTHDARLFRELRASYDGGQQALLTSLWERATVADLSPLPAMAPPVEPLTQPC